jgi:hypothetical protein
VEADPLSPEDRRNFDRLVEVIEDELRVQISMRRLDSQDGEKVNADLIADVIWDVFEVRPRATPLEKQRATDLDATSS